MTAPGSGEQITAELAEALEERFSYATAYATVELDWQEEAAALLPVVEAYATRKAAEELRAAANEYEQLPLNDAPAAIPWLNARADALTATPNHGTDATT